jgi:hypothetical protein
VFAFCCVPNNGVLVFVLPNPKMFVLYYIKYKLNDFKLIPPNEDCVAVLAPKVGVVVVFPNKLPAVVPAGLLLKREVLLPKIGGALEPKLVVAMFLPKADCPNGLLCADVLKPTINKLKYK